MLEIPESYAISKQIVEHLKDRRIVNVVANASPHGFGWFHGAPEAYPALLEGRTITGAEPAAGIVVMRLDGAVLWFNDGINLRLYEPGRKRPPKHQLLLDFDDESSLACTVQMYGGMIAYPDDYVDENTYFQGSVQKPSPLTDAFDRAYFQGICDAAKPTLSAKALLATEQRIPGLGNGVLQDILFLSGIHPARKISTLSAEDFDTLYRNIKDVLGQMAQQGGRDTEKDLLGNVGGYRTLLSRKTMGFPCPRCGGPIERKAYLGGNVYFCPHCQPLVK